MIARLFVQLPYTVAIMEAEKYGVFGGSKDDYRFEFFPPLRDSETTTERALEGLTLNAKPAVEANVLRIDFKKASFDRRTQSAIDPPEALVRDLLNDFHARFRFTTRAAHARRVDFPMCP